MAVPKRKTSKSRRNMRRSHDGLAIVNWSEDSNTGEAVRRHHVDPKTGMYKGKQILQGRG